eukprot:8042317-Heterocapsa_arctica.AAC.1
MSNGESKLIGVASGDATADTEVRVDESHTALGLGHDAAPTSNSRSTLTSSPAGRTVMDSLPLQLWLLDDANSLRQ